MDRVTTTQKARKEYDCEACLFIRDYVDEMGDQLPADHKVITDRLLTQQRGKILKGQPYYRTAGFDNGTVYNWRSGIEASAFCQDNDLYPDD